MRNGLLTFLAAVGLVGLGAFMTAPLGAAEQEQVAATADGEAADAEGEPAEEPADGAAEGEAEAASPAPSEPDCVPAPIEERAAQTLVVGAPRVVTGQEPLALELLELGVGGVFLNRSNVESPEQVRTLVDTLRAGSRVPLMVSTDEEGGRVSTFRELFGRTSSARTFGANQTPEEIQAFARQLGTSLADLGIDVNFAPVADLDDGDAQGIIGDRSFSADPQRATEASLAFSRGLLEGGVLPTAKHFPGHGRSEVNSHVSFSTANVAIEDLQATDLAPFQEQIDAGVPVVMLAHVGYTALDPGLPASLDPKAYALLRDMGFQGVAMTDSLGMGAVNVNYPYPDAAVRAIAAGADALLATDGTQARAMRDALVAAVADGRIPESRIDEAAARMLVLKGADPSLLTCTDPQTPGMVATLRRAPAPAG